MAQPTVEELTARFALAPHPEGGFFSESYRATNAVTASYGERAASTAIAPCWFYDETFTRAIECFSPSHG